MRKQFLQVSAVVLAVVCVVSYFWHPFLFTLVIFGPLILLGISDLLQTKQTIRRNFPILGHGRYLMELIRPEINQYFVESNSDGVPFDRGRRSVIYQRAKGVLDTLPFGTQMDVYANDYEWVNHSLVPKPVLHEAPRIKIGGKDCQLPYMASVFNVSAMSYGALSKNAILALNGGAFLGGFYHNSGEGGLSPYHLQPGGDVVWQIGTGYFGCRNKDGTFSEAGFQKRAQLKNVRMIEIKLSQGAKPGHGGLLPAKKLTQEIVDIRGVEFGKDVLSPPAHSTFNSPLGLLEFVQKLRKLSGGKPVGFKLCVGSHKEFLGIVKAMLQSQILPDFITVDGAEGGTGAAPVEFSNSVGTPLNEGLSFIHNALVGVGLRDQIRIIAAGKIVTGFNIMQKMALGADLCNSARGMLFALGCIQALRCNSNACPTGVATQDPDLVRGLHVGDKTRRVANFHKATVNSFLEVIAAAGIAHPSEIRSWHIHKRVSSTQVSNYQEIYGEVVPGSFLVQGVPEFFSQSWADAKPDAF